MKFFSDVRRGFAAGRAVFALPIVGVALLLFLLAGLVGGGIMQDALVKALRRR